MPPPQTHRRPHTPGARERRRPGPPSCGRSSPGPAAPRSRACTCALGKRTQPVHWSRRAALPARDTTWCCALVRRAPRGARSPRVRARPDPRREPWVPVVRAPRARVLRLGPPPAHDAQRPPAQRIARGLQARQRPLHRVLVPRRARFNLGGRGRRPQRHQARSTTAITAAPRARTRSACPGGMKFSLMSVSSLFCFSSSRTVDSRSSFSCARRTNTDSPQPTDGDERAAAAQQQQQQQQHAPARIRPAGPSAPLAPPAASPTASSASSS